MTPDQQNLARRLEKLELNARWMKRALVSASVVLATIVLMGGERKAEKEKLTALSSLILCDDAGRACGWLSVSQNGIGLVYADESGRLRSGLGLGRNAAGLQYFHPNGAPHCGLSIEKNGVSTGLNSVNGSPLVGVNAIKDVLGDSLKPRLLFKKSTN